MKTETILIAGAVVAVGVLFVRSMSNRPAGAPGAAVGSSWYAQSAGQAQITQQAINANWAALQNDIFKSQPNFWV